MISSGRNGTKSQNFKENIHGQQFVKWELVWLRKRGLIKNVRLGHFHITELGKEVLALCESYKKQK